jgi:hypothetical protein
MATMRWHWKQLVSAACAEAQHIGELVASIPSLLGESGDHCAIEPTGANRFCTESDR